MKLNKFIVVCVLMLAGIVFADATSTASAPAAPAPTASATSDSQSTKPASQAVSLEPQASAADVAFSKGFVSIEGGEMYPFGDLIDAVNNAFYGGLGFRYAYMEHVDGIVLFNYAYFTPYPDGVKIYGVHQFSGKLGVDWRWSAIRPLALGVGFACSWTRADFDDEKITENSFHDDLGGTLTDNETEFGWFVRANLPFLYKDKFTVGLNVLWEEIWTLPERSNMLSVGVYVERRLW